MTIQTLDGVLLYLLNQNAGLASLVSGRIYAGELPLDCDFPAISFYKISNPYSRLIGSPRYQISSWAEEPLTVQLLAQAVEDCLDGYSGIVESWKIIRIIPINSQDMPRDGTEIYHIPYDFYIFYEKN